MATYIVLRHGSNGANQTGTESAIVGMVVAKNRAEAREKFREQSPTVTVYANQRLEFVPRSRAKPGQIDEAYEADAQNEAIAAMVDEIARD